MRKCITCGTSLEGRHINAKYCFTCYKKHRKELRVTIYNKNRRGKYYNNTEEYRRRDKQRYAKKRLRIIEVYSNGTMCCKECGETFMPMLTIDHINNDGWTHRKKVGAGHRFYNWLIKNNYPSGFQVLCHVCNVKKYWDTHKSKNNYNGGNK